MVPWPMKHAAIVLCFVSLVSSSHAIIPRGAGCRATDPQQHGLIANFKTERRHAAPRRVAYGTYGLPERRR
jgi:hypothetical protein